MIAKIITNIILIISLGVIQISFISGLPGWFSNLNLVLVVLIFILGFSSLDLAVWWSVGIGFIMEIFSFFPFGAHLLSLSLAIVIASYLLDYFFTNRSLYSFLALVAISPMVYKLIIDFIIIIFIELGEYTAYTADNFFKSFLEQISLNLLFTLIIFYLIHFLGVNLKPVFLIKNKKY